jgi:hypothetical protein
MWHSVAKLACRLSLSRSHQSFNAAFLFELYPAYLTHRSSFMSTVAVASRSKTTSSNASLSEKEEPVIETAVKQVPHEKKRFGLWSKKRQDLDNIATQPSVFDDPVTLEVYRPPPSYENAHRFDPTARWTFREEIVSNRAQFSSHSLLRKLIDSQSSGK